MGPDLPSSSEQVRLSGVAGSSMSRERPHLLIVLTLQYWIQFTDSIWRYRQGAGGAVPD